MGMLAGIGFSCIGLHYTVPIALLVAATSMIPLVGPIAAGTAGCLVAFMQWGTFSGLMKVILITGGIRFIDDWFLQPLILRRAVHVHPAITLFALMAGGALCGFWGLLFAVPVVCMVKVLLEVIWQWYRSEYDLQAFDPAPEITHIPLI
jgi:predicted PurR-regulated permease PerM